LRLLIETSTVGSVEGTNSHREKKSHRVPVSSSGNKVVCSAPPML
jgi:hypothetical protein